MYLNITVGNTVTVTVTVSGAMHGCISQRVPTAYATELWAY